MPMKRRCLVYNGINIYSHSRFGWQNQDNFDLQFSIGARSRTLTQSRSCWQSQYESEIGLLQIRVCVNVQYFVYNV